jgi:hypothetical protein
MGSGAFTSVEAERNVEIGTAGDASALLEIKPNDDYDGDESQYLTWTDENLLKIDIDKLNKDAVTTFNDLIEIRNTGGSDLSLWVNGKFGEKSKNSDDADPIYSYGYGSSGPVDILRDGSSIVGGNVNQTNGKNELQAGSSALLTVEVDTRTDRHQENGAYDGEYEIVAE